MFGNIYENKRYKLYPLVPIVLLLISLYFIPKIPLDSTLRGGISIQLQTNASVDAQSLTSLIDAKIPQAQASVSAAQGGVSITLVTNSSIANGQQQLQGVYAYYANYSSASALVAGYQHELSVDPQNSTAQAALKGATANETAALNGMGSSVGSLLHTLAPLENRTYNYNFSNAQQMINVANGAYTNASNNYKSSVLSALHSLVPFTQYTYSEVTPTLGAFFLQQIQTIIIASFVIVAIAVFILFRTPIPSMSVVLGAGTDIIVALGAMGLLGIPLGVASIGGLLMLIGYSIDTDMLAAIRILKRTEGTPSERAFATMKTGITMTFAAIITFTILLIVSYVAFIPTYFEISGVVLAGLVADLATTWLGNTPMVLWYKKRKEVS